MYKVNGAGVREVAVYTCVAPLLFPVSVFVSVLHFSTCSQPGNYPTPSFPQSGSHLRRQRLPPERTSARDQEIVRACLPFLSFTTVCVSWNGGGEEGGGGKGVH